MDKKLGRIEILAIVMLAALVVWFVSGFFEPLTDGGRAEMMIEATKDLPQNR